MSDTLTLGGAFLLGLVASGHCLVMCGGISTALGLATARDGRGRPRSVLLVGYQLGRIASYALFGFLFAGLLGGLIALLDAELLRHALRTVSALVMATGALVVLGYARDPGNALGRRVWPTFAALGRRLLPVASLPRALAFGMLWGWMPCGFIYTVLLIAALQADAILGALIMAAFGMGTAPALLAGAFGVQRLGGWTTRSARPVVGTVLFASAALTLTGPWLVELLPGLHGWLPFACSTHVLH